MSLTNNKLSIIEKLIDASLEEDTFPNGDQSAILSIPTNKTVESLIIAKDNGIMACSYIVEAILTYSINFFEKFNYFQTNAQREFSIEKKFEDGQPFKVKDTLFRITYSARLAVSTERVILNILQKTCGIATETDRILNLIDNNCKLLDTRKTSPAMRILEKQAFAIGGGTNHRLNLSDMIMLKENHLSIINADLIETLKNIRTQTKIPIEIEINQDNLDKLHDAMNYGANIIMFDNFPVDRIKKILNNKETQRLRKEKNIKFEASGGISPENMNEYSKTGVDFISTSWVNKHAKDIDLSMKFMN